MELTKSCEDEGLRTRIFTSNTIPYIQGRLFSGAEVTLLGCHMANGERRSGAKAFVSENAYAEFAF